MTHNILWRFRTALNTHFWWVLLSPCLWLPGYCTNHVQKCHLSYLSHLWCYEYETWHKIDINMDPILCQVWSPSDKWLQFYQMYTMQHWWFYIARTRAPPSFKFCTCCLCNILWLSAKFCVNPISQCGDMRVHFCVNTTNISWIS